MTTMGKRVLTYYYYNGNSISVTDAFTELFTYVASLADPPKVFSFSYGAGEPDAASVSLFDTETAKLALLGVSVLASSGDNGVTGNDMQYYTCAYYPSFPAAAQYVTSVGATMGGLDYDYNNEIACSNDQGALITSGGGFSTVEPGASWQTAGVNDYFNKVLIQPHNSISGTGVDPSYNTFVKTNRAFPDLSFAGHNFAIFDGGVLGISDGTSASSPSLAGMISAINSVLVENNKPTLGFLNPTIWAAAGDMTRDITWGSNFCQEQACCGPSQAGFYAARGWDPLTGWGVPG